ncbi:MAG: Asp-tRNA(Asn)/Glu-tRNA(Gln) amidotransferase subunit GatB [Ruminococcaceae bacterium]|nr:Asp-tRNA(Asn)/Glu-tRNA(Gln) amidotransferase subunit GatB [Oscillospiraceae bacterium]
MNYINDYEAVIGLEVHVELKTETKIFCRCSASFGGEPNTKVCPVCLGLPGALPVLNKKAVDLAIKAGLCTGCEISEISFFDRKNYFYPDLPKAYQITQFDVPLCKNGSLLIETEDGEKRVGITRIHIEEDAGKLNHDNEKTLIDCNRCGVGLIEIVTEPDLRSGDEAKAFLKKLRTHLLYAGVSDCKMNEGSLRCDVNLSVRKRGETALGVRTEMKNLNSFQFVGKAIEYEYRRQVQAVERGEQIVQETRRFDAQSGKTFSMRTKENANDYRFFPEPDLPPLVLSQKHIEKLKSEIPSLPDEREERYIKEYCIPCKTARIIAGDVFLADYFERCAAASKHPEAVANLLTSFIMGMCGGEHFECNADPLHFACVADMQSEGVINSQVAKMLLADLCTEDFDPLERVEREALAQIQAREELLPFVIQAISESERAVADYKKGKASAAKSIVGKAMGLSQKKAEPKALEKLVMERLELVKGLE